MEQTESYTFVIKTNKFTGMFGRQLCAYITGCIGECGVGDKQAEDFKEEIGKDVFYQFEKIIQQKPDKHDCYRPVSARPTPKDAANYVSETYEFNDRIYGVVCRNDMEIYFHEQPTTEMIEIMKQRAYEYAKMKDIEIFEFELLKEVEKTTYEKIDI